MEKQVFKQRDKTIMLWLSTGRIIIGRQRTKSTIIIRKTILFLLLLLTSHTVVVVSLLSISSSSSNNPHIKPLQSTERRCNYCAQSSTTMSTSATITPTRSQLQRFIGQNTVRRRRQQRLYYCSSPTFVPAAGRVQKSTTTTTVYNHQKYNHDFSNHWNTNNNIETSTTTNEQYTTKYNELMSATKLSLAPMMEYTDRHFRYLVRLISQRTLLYTEMVPANAIARERSNNIQQYITTNRQQQQQQQQQQQKEANDNNIDLDLLRNEAMAKYDLTYIHRFIGQAGTGDGTAGDDRSKSSSSSKEGVSVLQVGGSDPQQLYEAAVCVREATERNMCNYTAINLNCGCPSPKVANQGCFGAALMDDPLLVAQLVTALHNGCNGQLPITVKCRIGTDSLLENRFTKSSYINDISEKEEYQRLCNFIETVAATGVVTDFQIHARIAVLSKSFSPADNRKIPPLKYHYIYQLVQDYPHLTFSLNGGITRLSEIQDIVQNKSPNLQGVMVGRAWAADPWRFAMADELLYGANPMERQYRNRYEILEAYGHHADYEEQLWDPLKVRRFITKAISPLFAGEPNSKQYRIELDTITRQLKQQQQQYEGSDHQKIPISKLLINAALQHLSEDVLLRTPEQSYERIVWEEQKALQPNSIISIGFSTTTNVKSYTTPSTDLVAEWQLQRKQEQEEIENQPQQDDENVKRNETETIIISSDDDRRINTIPSLGNNTIQIQQKDYTNVPS